MLKEVLSRRFRDFNPQNETNPDLVIIDGGLTQLSAAHKIWTQLKINIPFACMSKGKKRNAGEEYFHQIGRESFTLPKNHPLMHYLQRLRDEAHRFAIMAHRKKRQKSLLGNP